MTNFYTFLLLLGVIKLTHGVTVTYEQTILNDQVIVNGFYGNDVSGWNDWIVVGRAENTAPDGEVQVMKWNGTHYDDTNRIKFYAPDSNWGTRVEMNNGWMFISGHGQNTTFYRLDGADWVFDSSIAYGAEANRNPDTGIQMARSVDTNNDGTLMAVFDEVAQSFRVYSLSGNTWSMVGSEVSLQSLSDPRTITISGDGTRLGVCQYGTVEGCEIYELSGGNYNNFVTRIDRAYLGAPFDSDPEEVGRAMEMNDDGSIIVICQNDFATGPGHVHFMEETSPGVWTIVQSIEDNDGWGGGTYDLIGGNIRYEYEIDLWLISDPLHSSRDGGSFYRWGEVYLYRQAPNGTFILDTAIHASDYVTGSFHDDNFGGGGMVYNNGRLIFGTKSWEEPGQANSNDGRVDIFEIDITPYPTPQPTAAPTASPTPNPRVAIGTVEVTMTNTNASKTQESATLFIDDISQDYDNVDFLVEGKDDANIDLTGYDTSGLTESELIQFVKDSANCTECTVTIGGLNGRRILQESTTITVELTYSLDDTAYAELQANGNTLDSPEFLDALAADLGVNSTDLDVTLTGSEVVVEVTLISESSESAPIDESAIQELQDLEEASEAAATTIVNEIGGGTVTVSEVDLCADRTCSGQGVVTSETDANGCIIETGVCNCNGDYWGINCDQECTCENGGTCVNSYCQCPYPYSGMRCEVAVDCSC